VVNKRLISLECNIGRAFIGKPQPFEACIERGSIGFGLKQR
jgi:hypothetical protein